MKPIETWRDERKTPDWIFAGLRVRYPAGYEITSDDYDAACVAVKTHVPGRSPKENA